MTKVNLVGCIAASQFSLAPEAQQLGADKIMFLVSEQALLLACWLPRCSTSSLSAAWYVTMFNHGIICRQPHALIRLACNYLSGLLLYAASF